MRKPKVGEVLYSLNIGNAFRKNCVQKLTPMVVSKVGRKYFTLKKVKSLGDGIQFHLSNWWQKTEFCKDYEIYESVKSYEDKVTMDKNIYFIKNVFSYSRNCNHLSLKQVSAIVDILKE